MRGCSSACVGGWVGDGGGCGAKGEGGGGGDVRASVRRRCRASVSWNLNDLDICAETKNERNQQGHHIATRTKRNKKETRPIMRAINRGIASR